MLKQKSQALVRVTAAGKTIRRAYRKTVTPEVWEAIFAKLVAAAKQGDLKSIELLMKLGGAGVTSLNQNNYYYGDEEGPPPGNRRGKPTAALPGTMGKLKVLRRRASRGQALDCDSDASRNGD